MLRARLTSLQQAPQAPPAPLAPLQLRPHVPPPPGALHAGLAPAARRRQRDASQGLARGRAARRHRKRAAVPETRPAVAPPPSSRGAASRGLRMRAARSGRSEEARGPAAATGRGQGHGDGGGERVQPGLGERAAATLGRAGAGDRGGAAERGHGHPGAVQGEAERAPAGATRRAVRGLRAEGGVGALRPDPLPHAGGHGAAARGLQLLRAQGLPDGAEPRRLRPREAGRARPDLRADAGAAGRALTAPGALESLGGTRSPSLPDRQLKLPDDGTPRQTRTSSAREDHAVQLFACLLHLYPAFSPRGAQSVLHK